MARELPWWNGWQKLRSHFFGLFWINVTGEHGRNFFHTWHKKTTKLTCYRGHISYYIPLFIQQCGMKNLAVGCDQTGTASQIRKPRLSIPLCNVFDTTCPTKGYLESRHEQRHTSLVVFCTISGFGNPLMPSCIGWRQFCPWPLRFLWHSQVSYPHCVNTSHCEDTCSTAGHHSENPFLWRPKFDIWNLYKYMKYNLGPAMQQRITKVNRVLFIKMKRTFNHCYRVKACANT